MTFSYRGVLASLGVLAVIYALALLEFVVVSPDLRLRGFLVDSSGQAVSDGIVVRATMDLEHKHGLAPPQAGDVLINVNGRPTPTLLDYYRAVGRLYYIDEDFSGKRFETVGAKDRPQDLSPANVGPRLLEIDELGQSRRLVEVLYRATDSGGRIERSYVEIQSPPPEVLLLSILWLVPHLVILFVGGAACWQRPFDRAARVFFMMCVVTTVAYVGGFHWWTVANAIWLAWPFILCGVLLPAVTLHFFLVYPRPANWSVLHPRWQLTALYSAPIAASVAMGVLLMLLNATPTVGEMPDPDIVREKTQLLGWLRWSINAFLVIAACYYALTLAILVRTVLTVRDPVEQAQVRWILGAATLAALPVGYTMYLAVADRVAFAFGGARYSMFFASFVFLFAYAAGMIKHRLLLADEVIGKGPRYYAARAGLTTIVALALAGMALWIGAWDTWLPRPQSAASVTAVIVLAVFLLLFARDRLQQSLDRRFFSQKYQLGAALRGMQMGAGLFSDENDLGQRVIDSCERALGVERVAVYRRADSRTNVFHLAAARGEFPQELRLEKSVVEFVEAGGSVHHILTGSHSDISPRQSLLRRLQARLLYAPPGGEHAATLLVLGSLENDANFSAEDLTFLSALGHVADVAFAGAGTHQRLAEQLRLAEGTIASDARQISVLQKELARVHQRPGGATPALDAPFRREIIHGESEAINEVLETVRKVASSDATVMIRGESGTGKELLAQVIHDNSARPEGPLVRVHCAALSPTLLESELFGHVKGAFTGADRDKIGRFELAGGGTLFLDEIGEISAETQVKLLRVMQERCFEPVGSSKTIEVDVRIITATNRNLEEMIADGRFREDLYYRLNVISVTLPPLRERKGDVMDLTFTFLHQAARRLDKSLSRIDEDVLDVLRRYQWPGNIRELQNVIERAVVLADGPAITLDDLPAEMRPGRSSQTLPSTRALPREPLKRRRIPKPSATPSQREPDPETAPADTDNGERQALREALSKTQGNKARAARLMGMPRSTFFSKLKKYDLT